MLLVFLENITCPRLDKSELKIIFRLYVRSDIFLDLYLIDQPRY